MWHTDKRDAIIYSLVLPKENPWFLFFFCSLYQLWRSDELTTPSDENSESHVLYTLVQIGIQSLWVGNLHGDTPLSPLFCFLVTWPQCWILIGYWYSYKGDAWISPGVKKKHHETQSSFARACARRTSHRTSLFHLSTTHPGESFGKMCVDAVLSCVHAPGLLQQHGGTFADVW